MYLHDYVVVEDPVDATVCEGDNATFTCVVFIPSGIFPTSPGWRRSGTTVDMIRHTITSNLTGNPPIYVSSTVTVSNVTVLDDDSVTYECGIGSSVRNATLHVEGKYFFIT